MMPPRTLSRFTRRTAVKTWTLLNGETYDHGGAEGSAYTTGPATGWTHSADFGFTPRITLSGYTDRGLRFPTLSEAGSGGSHSEFRAQAVMSSTYMTNSGVTSDFRVDWVVRVPAAGGYTRQDGGGYSSTFAAFGSFGNLEGTRSHTVAVYKTGQLGLWMNSSDGVLACPATAPTASSASVTMTAGTWYTVSLQVQLSQTAGTARVYWDGAKVIEVTGDTRFSAGTAGSIRAAYVTCLAGGTSSTSDLSYFSAMDGVVAYK